MEDISPSAPEREETERLDRMPPLPRISIQAFCESDSIVAPIERAGADRRMSRASLRVHTGGIKAAIEHFSTAPTPNLVIVETRLGPTELVDALETLADVCDPGSKVALIGHYNDVALYRDLIRRGISEYLVAPISLADVIGMISGLFASPDAELLGRSIAFIGAKGGVGSSTIAHNVGFTISKLFATDVMIADLDLPFGTANINFDRDPPQGIAEAVFSAERMDETLLDRLLSKCSENLSLLAAPSLLDRTYDLERDAFSALIETAQRGTPVVVLDVPHLWNEWTRSVLGAADQIVLTATPDLANLRNAKNIVDTLGKLRPNDASPHLILNQTAIPKRPEISSAEFCEPLGLKPIAEIAFDPQVFGDAANGGQMIAEADARHSSVEAFRQIAHILTGRDGTKVQKKPRLIDRIMRKTA